MASYTDRYLVKPSVIAPPIRSSYRPIPPQSNRGVPIRGAADYAEAERMSQIALDQFGYALTPEEQAQIDPQQGGTGFLDGLFDLLEAPLNTIKSPFIYNQTKPGTDYWEMLGAIWTSDDERLIQMAPHLEGEEGEANLSSAALMRGSGKSPEHFGEKAGWATAGIALDILADPLSWISFGTLGLGRTLAKEGAEAALRTGTKQATEALVRGNVSELSDSLAIRIAGEITEKTQPLRDELFDKVIKASDGELDDAAREQLRRAVDEEVFMHEADRATTLLGGQSQRDFSKSLKEITEGTADEVASPLTSRATRRERWGDNASLFDDALDDGVSYVSDYYNRLTSLVADKQFGTLADEFPEFIKSSYSPTHSTGGVTITTPFFRKQAGGVSIGFRTNRGVTKPVRSAVSSIYSRLPSNNRVRKAVEGLWRRRGVEVAARRIASGGKAWQLSHAQGAAREALQALNVKDAPIELTQSLRSLERIARETGDDHDTVLRAFGSALDGELNLADLEVANPLFKTETVAALREAHGVARATLDTLHKALTEFDPELGYIDDYFPLMASRPMSDIIQSLQDGGLSIPIRQMESAAQSLAEAGDEAAAARLRVGSHILGFWSDASVDAAKASGDARVVLDHSRFMNSRLLGKTVFSRWADLNVDLADRAAITRLLGGGELTNDATGWSSRTALNDAVRDALRFMEDQGTLKLPKDLDPFDMDIPAVLDAYVKATERVLNFKAFVRASEQVKLVKAAEPFTEVGITLSNIVSRVDPQTKQVLEAWLDFVDGKRVKALTDEMVTHRIGKAEIELPKGMEDIPVVKQAMDVAREAARKNAANHGLAREAAEKRITDLVNNAGLPREVAEEFAALESSAEVRNFVAALWSGYEDKVAGLRSAARELAEGRDPAAVETAMKELKRVERQWRNGISDAMAKMQDSWREQMGYTRWNIDTAVNLDDPIEELGGMTRGAALAGIIEKGIAARVDAEINKLDPFRRAELGVDTMNLDQKLKVLDTIAMDDTEEVAQAAAFKAFRQVQDLVESTGLTMTEVVDEIGPLEAMRLVRVLAGFGSAPVENEEIFDVVKQIARDRGDIAYGGRIVNSANEVGDLKAINHHYTNELDDVAPQALPAFKGLADELAMQVRYLEDMGFEFQLLGQGRRAYNSLDEFRSSLETRQVFLEWPTAEVPPALQAITVPLGNGVEVPLVAALEGVHKILGYSAHGYADDVVGQTNAWLSHLQLFPRSRGDIRQAFTTLTRARRVASDLAGEDLPYKMDLVDPRMATPWRASGIDEASRRAGDEGAAMGGVTTDDAVDAGTGYAGSTVGKTPDRDLQEVDFESRKAQGFLEPWEQDYSESQLNKADIEQSLDNDRRRFDVAWQAEGMREQQLLADQLNKEYQTLANAHSKLPVRVVEAGEGPARVMVTMASGKQMFFRSMEEARAWWVDEYVPKIAPEVEYASQVEVRNLDELPDSVLDNERYNRFRTPSSGPREFTSTDDVRELRKAAEEGAELTQGDLERVVDYEQIGEVTPMAGVQGEDALTNPYDRNAPEFADRKPAFNAEVYGPEQAAGPFHGPVKPGKPQQLKGFTPKKKVSAVDVGDEGRLYEMADGSISVFQGAQQYHAQLAQARRYIETSRGRIIEKTAKFVESLDRKGITLQGLLEEPPPGLMDAKLSHPLFTDKSWQGIVRAAYKKNGAVDGIDEADSLVRSWRESAIALSERPGLRQMIDAGRGLNETVVAPGGGVLQALRSGDTQLLVAQEAALRNLLERVGLDPTRLIIQALGDGTHRLRWGAEQEFVSTKLDDILPALRETLQGVGIDTRGMSFREMLAHTKARGLSHPTLDNLLDYSTVKGNLPVDLEDYFYLQETLSKVKAHAAAGRADLMDSVGADALAKVLAPLESVMSKRGGDLTPLVDAWGQNKAAIAKHLTPRDYAALEDMVERAQFRRSLGTEAELYFKQEIQGKMYADANQAVAAILKLKEDLYQGSSEFVRKYYADVIESADYFAGRYVTLLGNSRGWRGDVAAGLEGFEPHYNQILTSPADAAEFGEQAQEVVESMKRVRNDLLGMLSQKGGALEGDRKEFLDYITEQMGDVVPKGDDLGAWVRDRMASLKNLKDPVKRVNLNTADGFVDQAALGLKSTELDGKIVDANLGLILESMASHVAAMWTPTGVKMLKDQVNAFVSYWKAATTVARPTFVFRNMVGGVFNGMIADVGAREYAWVSNRALKVRRALDNGSTFEQALESLDAADAEVFRAAQRMGIFDTEFTSDLNLNQVGRRMSLKPWDSNFVLFNLGGRFMQRSEDFMRMAAFRRWYESGQEGSEFLAREMVNAVHFNYGSLTQFETKIKKAIPFYVWTRRNIPLQMQTLFERPGIANRYQIIQQNVEASFSDEDDPAWGLPFPEWMGSQAASLGTMLHGGAGEEGGPDWTRFVFSPDLPFRDFEQLLGALTEHESGAFLGAMEWAGNTVTPIIKIPMDILRNSQYETSVPAPLGMAQAMQIFDGLLPFGDVGVNAETGHMEVPYWMRSAYEGIVPFQREILETFGIQQNDPRRAARLGVDSSDGIEVGERIIASVLSLARSAGVRGQTPQDLIGAQVGMEETVDRVLTEAQREGRILSDPEGRRLTREDLARIVGDPYEGKAPGGDVPENVQIIDGDTFRMDGETIRIAFANAAETGSSVGQEATDYLRLAMSNGSDVRIVRKGTDDYGRTIAEVFVDGQNISDALIGAGQGRYIPAVHRVYQPNLVGS